MALRKLVASADPITIDGEIVLDPTMPADQRMRALGDRFSQALAGKSLAALEADAKEHLLSAAFAPRAEGAVTITAKAIAAQAALIPSCSASTSGLPGEEKTALSCSFTTTGALAADAVAVDPAATYPVAVDGKVAWNPLPLAFGIRVREQPSPA